MVTCLNELRGSPDAGTAEGLIPVNMEITCMWPGQGGIEAVQALAEVGVSRLVVPLMALGGDPVEGFQKLSEEVIQAL